jgi:hypothetical protein
LNPDNLRDGKAACDWTTHAACSFCDTPPLMLGVTRDFHDLR